MKWEFAFQMVFLTILLVSSFTAFEVQKVEASGTIYIRSDGSIDPQNASISTLDYLTYTLTNNIASDDDGIVVERDHIIVDGTGYTVQGTEAMESRGIDLSGKNNVTIKNMTIRAFEYGIWIGYSSNSSIVGNNITANTRGVYLNYSSDNNLSGNNLAYNGHGIVFYSSSNNVISGNNITNNSWVGILFDSSNRSSVIGNNITANNDYGIHLSSCSNNSIFQNNFNNTNQAHSDYSINIWDSGYPSGGNYWSDYNGTDANHDGIGDSTYVIDANNTDHYPLMTTIPEFPSFLILPLFFTAMLLAVVICRRKRR